MRQKHLEVRKTQAIERVEKKLDLLAKFLGVDFSALDESPAVESVPAEGEAGQNQEPEGKPEETPPAEPEAKPRKNK